MTTQFTNRKGETVRLEKTDQPFCFKVTVDGRDFGDVWDQVCKDYMEREPKK